MPANQATATIEDYDREKSGTSVNIGPLTAANFTAKRAAIDAWVDSLPGIIKGEVRKVNINEVFAESSAVITDQNAQRESKWLVFYRDDTQFLDVGNTINNVGFGNIYHVEIPTADLTLLGNNEDTLDLSLGAVAAFVTAFEAVQNSPTGGNEVTVIKIQHAGRNL